MGLPEDLVFRTKGQLAIDILAEAFADGVRLDFVCGDEVYGCLHRAARVPGRPRPGLRAAGPVQLPPHPGRRHHADLHSRPPRGWAAGAAGRSAPPGPDPKDERWYAWAWLATASPRHHLLIRRHLEHRRAGLSLLLPARRPAGLPARLIRAAGLRWPVEEDFEFGKDCFGLDQSQVRLYTAIARHTVLVMAALAICAVTAALLRRRTGTQAPAPVLPDQPPPADPGMIPLTVPETGRLLARPPPPGSAEHWLDWRRRHQARSRWYHQRTRLARGTAIVLVS